MRDADPHLAWCAGLFECPNCFSDNLPLHPAKWDELGAIAGRVRNQQMVDTHPDLLIAFPGGRGTRHCIRQAVKAGIEIIHG